MQIRHDNSRRNAQRSFDFGHTRLLTLVKTDEICRAAESMQAQMKVVGDVAETEANIVGQERTPNSRKSKKNMRRRQQQGPRRGKECDNCGYQHPENQDSCTTIGKECLKCGKRNDFISRCKSKEVKATDLEDEDSGEIYQTEVAAVKLDDSQLVTLKLSLVTLFGSNLIPEPNVT